MIFEVFLGIFFIQIKMNNNIDIFKKITIKKQVYVDREPEKSNKVIN